MNDEELMLAYQKGSEEAFNDLYQKYSPMVYGFIRPRLRSSEAEDFYQKVWRHLHEKRHLYQKQPFAPWFFVMIRHLLIDEYRGLGRRNEFQSELMEKLYGTIPETENEIKELLASLPQETADLIRKYYLEGISYEELESETGLTQASLRQRLSRAIKGLRGTT